MEDAQNFLKTTRITNKPKNLVSSSENEFDELAKTSNRIKNQKTIKMKKEEARKCNASYLKDLIKEKEVHKNKRKITNNKSDSDIEHEEILNKKMKISKSTHSSIMSDSDSTDMEVAQIDNEESSNKEMNISKKNHSLIPSGSDSSYSGVDMEAQILRKGQQKLGKTNNKIKINNKILNDVKVTTIDNKYVCKTCQIKTDDFCSNDPVILKVRTVFSTLSMHRKKKYCPDFINLSVAPKSFTEIEISILFLD